MSYLRAALGMAVLVVLGLGGCGESRYRVHLDAEGGLEGTAAFELVLLRVTCQQIIDNGGAVDGGWVVARVQWRPGEDSQDIGEVEPGLYSLVAIARGADCYTIAAVCEPVRLERGGDETFDLTLGPVSGFGCLTGEICAGEGLCTPAPQCDNVTLGCDNDGDGWRVCLEGQDPTAGICDCWDDSGEVHPGNEELCDDGLDNDCSGEENDDVACQDCETECPAADECQRPDCTDGPCVIVDRRDGAPCGDGGLELCCNGECGGACTPEEVGTRGCGAGICGHEERVCGADCQWGDWSECVIDENDCTPGDTRTNQPCGNCGTRDEVCSAECLWVADGACEGEGVCAPGAMSAAMNCGDCGLRIDTCAANCTWTPGACDGTPGRDVCVDPDVCCADGTCVEGGVACCGTDTATCGPEPLCQDWTCEAGLCTANDEDPDTDLEDECDLDCCDGAGACAPCA